jgi:phosphopantothenoylcysteine decarboxylase/phosphopantothenate--cysteine ligase
MNKQMWANTATQRNVQQLMTDRVVLLGPDSGVQACGEEGIGRMVEAEVLAREVVEYLLRGASSKECSSTLSPSDELGRVSIRHRQPVGLKPDLLGLRVLITAGPTYEAIDAVRGITNRSSGKMGYAIAQAAMEMGADVTLVSGPTALSKPYGVQMVDVTSAAEMFEAVKLLVANADIFIGVAAVADYRVAQPSEQKIKKSDASLTLELIPNPDILAYVANLPKPPFCVGFAAESEKLREHATAKRKQKNIPLLAANLAQNAIGSDDNELTLFDDEGEHLLPLADKLTLARALLRHAASLYLKGNTK